MDCAQRRITTLTCAVLGWLVIVESSVAWQPGKFSPPKFSTPAPLVDPTPKSEPPAPIPAAKSPTEFESTAPLPLPEIETSKPIENRLPSFKGITPSKTTVEEVKKSLGEPVDQAELGRDALLVFDVTPFEKVEVVIGEGVVTTVIIHLKEPTAVEDLANELSIDDIVTAPIPDETGKSLGKVYPECGITFAFANNDESNARQIVLEQIAAEPFVLRAQYVYRQQFTRRIADLESAIKIDSKNAHIHWLLAKAQMETGNLDQARQHATEAVRLDANDAAYQLTKSEVLGKLGRIPAALLIVREVLATENLSNENRAKAEYLLGMLLSMEEPPNFKSAMTHYQTSIRFAASLASSKRAELRRSAKQILLDAHLGVAEVIAFGVWRRKDEVVPMWIGHAQQLAKDMVENESAHLDNRLQVRTRFLLLADSIGMTADPTNLIETTISDAHNLMGANDDKLTHQRISQFLSVALYHAASMEHRRGKSRNSLGYAQQSLSYLKQTDTFYNTNDRDYHRGRLEFLIGAIYAIHDKDHKTAIKWYDKATKSFAELEIPIRELNKHGDRYVAMGVSYWNAATKRDALKITEQGTRLIQNAVERGIASPSALAVPYNNLAGMHRELGNRREASRFAETAAQLRASKTQKR